MRIDQHGVGMMKSVDRSVRIDLYVRSFILDNLQSEKKTMTN